jgi:subtilisin family serine protease
MQAKGKRTMLIMAMLLALCLPAHAAAPLHPSYVAGEVLVKYRSGRAPARTLHYRSMWGMSNLRTYHKSGVRKIKLPPDMTVAQALAIYRADPDVLFAEPDYRYRILALPDDPDLDLQWGLQNTGQVVNGTTGTSGADLDAKDAWDLNTGSRDIVVAVVDSGVDLSHPDIAANIWTNPGEIAGNQIDDDGNGYVDDVHGWDFVAGDDNPLDPLNHGTHVAGIIGAVGDNALGTTGVCWRVSIMPLRFITAAGYGTTSEAIEAIEYADAMGADVINLSWGGPDFSQALKAAIDAAHALVVCAAGNDGSDMAVSPTYPAAFDSANILSVGASNADDDLASFSDYSDSLVDVAAPGTDIYSTVVDRQSIFADDFANLDHWTFGGDGNAWGQEDVDGNPALTESPAGDYTDDMDAWARLGPLNLSGQKASLLGFNIQGSTADSGDRLMVEASTDGSNWSAPLPVNLNDGTVQAISGTLSTWQMGLVDLKAYDNAGTFYLRFRFVSDAAGVGQGYFIDNVGISGAVSSYAYYDGTSMSAAYASGTAALVLAQHPSLTPTELKLAIESTVDPKPRLAGYVAAAGRINAYHAVISTASVDLRSRAAAGDSIDLNWTVQTPPDSGFEIQRRMDGGGDFATIGTVAADVTSYTDSGLQGGITYIYRVFTLNGTTRTGYSNEASATTPPAVTANGSSSSGGGGNGGCFISAAGARADSSDGIYQWIPGLKAALDGFFK